MNKGDGIFARLPCPLGISMAPNRLGALMFRLPQLEADAEAKSTLGHMREMYAFVAAAAVARFKLELQVTVEGYLWQTAAA